MNKLKLHYPILDKNSCWGIKPYCGANEITSLFALIVSKTTCNLCLDRIAKAQNRVEERMKNYSDRALVEWVNQMDRDMEN